MVERKLKTIQRENHSLVCVGLDSDLTRVPKEFLGAKNPQLEFNKVIVDATKDLVCAYKPNTAFYEAEGTLGAAALEETCAYIPDHIPVILDAKRGDIGNTSRMYAEAYFRHLGVDAVTIHPYMGSDTVTPFLDYPEKAVFILVKTSNPSAIEFEDLRLVTGEMLYETVARKVRDWDGVGSTSVGAVVGGTYPADIERVRAILPKSLLLIPGIGSQGGDIESVLGTSLADQAGPVVINSSRGVIFAAGDTDPARAARKACEELRETINSTLDRLRLDPFQE